MKATVRFIRHGGIYRSDVLSNLKDQGRSAAFRTGPAPAKRTRRKFPRPTHRRDEFRPAIPQRWVLASIARLRFTGTPILIPFRDRAQ